MKFIALLLSLFIAFPIHAAGPVIWGPGGAQNISSGPVYDNNVPYIKQPQTNYVANQSAGIDTIGWTSTGTFGVSRVTTGLPRANTVGTGLSFTTGGVDEYAQYCFTLDDSDLNTKLSWSWSQAPSSYADGDLVAQVYSFATANCGGSATQLYIDQVPSGQDYSIPNYTGPLELTFDVSSNPYYGIRYTRKAGSSTLVVSNVIVGPGEVIPMPAVGLVSVSPSFSNGNGLGPDYSNLITARINESLILNGRITFTGDGTQGSSLLLSFTGLTISGSPNGSVVLQSVGSPDVGVQAMLANTGSGLAFRLANGSGNIGANTIGTVYGTSSSRYVSIHFNNVSVPIAEWAASPNYVASASQAVVSSKANMSVNQTGINPNNSRVQLNYNNVLENVGGGSWSGGGFVVPHSGTYIVSGSLLMDGTNVLNSAYRLQVMKGPSFAGATIVGELDWYIPPIAGGLFGVYGSTQIKVNAGDIIYLALFGSGNNATNTLATLGAASVQYNMAVNRLTDEYGRPVVGFGYATTDSYGLVKLATGANASEARVENLTVGSISSTFTSNGTGGGTSSAVDILVRRQGNWVDVVIPAFSADAGTGTPNTYTANTALPAWARPNVNTIMSSGVSRNNGGTDTNEANIFVNTAGVISVRRNAALATFTTSASAGLQTVANIRYYVP